MATDSELKAAGFALPKGTDLLTDGDDAISKNADVAYTLINSAKWLKRGLTADDNPDALKGAGAYLIGTGATATALNLPDPAMSVLENQYFNDLISAQTLTTMGNPGRVWKRYCWYGNWTPWERIDGKNQSSGLAHTLLMDSFKTRRPVIKTGGRAAVALRFDHGFNKFKSIVMPLLKERGFRAAQAVNSRLIGVGENSEVSASEINQWVKDGVLEIWNHGATHSNVINETALKDVIVNGLSELREMLPDATIDGFLIPGVGANGYLGFNGGSSLESWLTSTAGQLILSHHAVADGGYAPNLYRVLDGSPKLGLKHYTLDNLTALNAVTSILDAAETQKAGVQFMLHPNVLGSSGKISVDLFTQFLDELKKRVDQGRILLLTPYEILRADSHGEADTGDRDVTALMKKVSAGKIYARRTGNRVAVDFEDVKLSDVSGSIGALPAGYRPSRTYKFWMAASANSLRATTANIDGSIFIESVTTSDVFRSSHWWFTDDPFPVS